MLVQKAKTGFPVWENVFGNLMYNDVESCAHNLKHTFRNSPAVNIKEDEKAYSIEMAAPGKKKEDFTIGVDKNVLTISSETKETKGEVKENFTRKEYSYESFKRSFTLPETTDQEGIKATYTDGILNITIPKKEIKKPEVKSIAVS